MHLIVFAEPGTWSLQGNDAAIEVPTAFYQMLVMGRPTMAPETQSSNAYVFGPLFPLNEYKENGFIGNEMGSVGLIDYDALRRQYEQRARQQSRGSTANMARMSMDMWLQTLNTGLQHTIERATNRHQRRLDMPHVLREVQRYYPWVLFLGETVGGNVGATLWVHYGHDGQIDGLIIDNDYFFTRMGQPRPRPNAAMTQQALPLRYGAARFPCGTRAKKGAAGLQGMTTSDMRLLLRERGLPYNGNRAQLCENLLAALSQGQIAESGIVPIKSGTRRSDPSQYSAWTQAEAVAEAEEEDAATAVAEAEADMAAAAAAEAEAEASAAAAAEAEASAAAAAEAEASAAAKAEVNAREYAEAAATLQKLGM